MFTLWNNRIWGLKVDFYKGLVVVFFFLFTYSMLIMLCLNNNNYNDKTR